MTRGDRAGQPRGMTDPNWSALVAFINAHHGTTFALGTRLAHGEQGALMLSDRAGARFVLKWQAGVDDLSRAHEVVRTVDRLRQRGYPAPRYVAVGLHAGQRYLVQAAPPGA